MSLGSCWGWGYVMSRHLLTFENLQCLRFKQNNVIMNMSVVVLSDKICRSRIWDRLESIHPSRQYLGCLHSWISKIRKRVIHTKLTRDFPQRIFNDEKTILKSFFWPKFFLLFFMSNRWFYLILIFCPKRERLGVKWTRKLLFGNPLARSYHWRRKVSAQYFLLSESRQSVNIRGAFLLSRTLKQTSGQ